MPDKLERKAEATTDQQGLQRTADMDQTVNQIVDAILGNSDKRNRSQAEAVAANLERLREALQCVRNVACDALRDAAPNQTIMVVTEEGTSDIIACRPVSDTVASNFDKLKSIRESGRQFRLCVDFVVVKGKTLTSAEACKTFLRHLDWDYDDD
jgi:hypothetical protein